MKGLIRVASLYDVDLEFQPSPLQIKALLFLSGHDVGTLNIEHYLAHGISRQRDHHYFSSIIAPHTEGGSAHVITPEEAEEGLRNLIHDYIGNYDSPRFAVTHPQGLLKLERICMEEGITTVRPERFESRLTPETRAHLAGYDADRLRRLFNRYEKDVAKFREQI